MGVGVGECRGANGCFSPRYKPEFTGTEKTRETVHMSALFGQVTRAK